MINKETIISVYNEKLTLLQWLKTINKALDEAVLTNVEITQRGNATFVFVFTFEDGTQVESNEIIVNQGESVNGASIKNGHLYLSLTNGDELDAGNVKPVTSFSINASQHLIVNYGDGTNQDLGAIFSGNVNIDGTLNATKVTGDEIIENMTGYTFVKNNEETGPNWTAIYVSAVKNGNKLTMVIFGSLIKRGAGGFLGFATIPANVLNKLYPTLIGSDNVLDCKVIPFYYTNAYTYINCPVKISKSSTGINFWLDQSNLASDTTYYFRYEVTFLLSDNLVDN